MRLLSLTLVPLALLTFSLPSTAAPPSYARDVRPFLARYCLECHNAGQKKGGLDLESYKSLMQGGRNGPVVAPGTPDDSRLVVLAEGKEKPFMPPAKARQPKKEEAAILRAWVAAGAKDDSANVHVTLPDIRPRAPVAPPVAALAYRADGKLLAVGTYREVLLLDPASGQLLGKLPGQPGKVTALAFSADGQHLAAASGQPAQGGEVRLYAVPPTGLPDTKPLQNIAASSDVIYNLVFSPDGKLLASCGYDRLIKLWDAATGHEVRTLKDHSDSIYGLAFSPDGKLLASAAADRAVKVWDVASGKRLYTLGESTDWVYAIAWSHDGKHLAAAGVDRSIRVWEVSAEGGKLVHSVFAHEGPVSRLVYSTDDQTLYSAGEDRNVKAWETRHMEERRVYPRQPALPLTLAVRKDQKQLAVGRFDGALVLLDEATGQVQSQPLPAKPKPPQITRLTPEGAPRGSTVRVTFEGMDLDSAVEVVSSLPGLTAHLLGEPAANRVEADVAIPPGAAVGYGTFALKNAAGTSAALPFAVDRFPAVAEVEPNESVSSAQKVALPATLAGSLGQAGDVDCYRFELKAGEPVGVQVVLPPGSKLEPVLKLVDATGRTLAESTIGVLGFTSPTTGTYALVLRDREFRGDAMKYRLHLGPVPVVTAVFPLGLQRGTEAEVHLDGVHLGGVTSVKVKAPAEAAPGTRIPLSVQTPLGIPAGNLSVVVGDLPEQAGIHGTMALVPPVTANGRLTQPGTAETWRFRAQKGQRLLVDVQARRIGSPLDSTIEILDAQGKPVPRATLRCLAKTYVVFRNHDSTGPGIRIESWSELAMDDYVYAGNELLRIDALPRNPDDDCRFASKNGQRLGFLGTTPTFISQGTPMYRVTVHPPGTTFPSNGMPLITLYYRNDDGGPGYGKDSHLTFDPPADGEYQVRVTDARGLGGMEYAYRLTVRPPHPDYTVAFSPSSPAVSKGAAVPVTVTAQRLDGYDGPIAVRLENLPPGLHAPATTIPAGEDSTAFALFADPSATLPAKPLALKLIAKATLDGREVAREAAGGNVQLIEPGDLVTKTQQSEVTLRPGGDVAVTVTIERRNGFGGRVPVEVRGLPHGVQVLDVGLNGILITEKETTRTFVLHAEPWVQPTEHPFVVLTKREGMNAEHAARSVLLKVVK